jgi:RNA polymerase sigma-70 factor (ECF subfamily)
MNEDQALSGRLATDLDGHFEQLVRSYQDRLYSFTLRLTRSREEAEECTQDAFVRAYRALSRYPGERVAALRLRPWLYQIALNVVRNRVRRAALPTLKLEDHVVINDVAADVRDSPESALLRGESRGRLERELRRLPERFRLAVVLRHVQGLSYVEAAEVLAQPVGTTKSDVHRGLRLLRESLANSREEEFAFA